MRAVVNVFLKNGVLDPQGKAVAHALGSLGFSGIKEARVGKQIILELEGNDEVKAHADAKAMCETLLANTVIEDYTVEIVR